MSNAGRDERERHVLDTWCALTGTRPQKVDKRERPDFVVDGESIEVVEVQNPGRRRQDEYKQDVMSLESGMMPEPREGLDLQDVVRESADWIADAIIKKAQKYGHAADSWTLIVYGNYDWFDRTDWNKVRVIVAAKVQTFKRIDVLSADEKKVIAIKP